MKTSRKRAPFAAVLASFAFVVPVSAKPAARPVQWKGMPLNRATAFITGPRYRDGSVDYIAAYNKMVGQGVTAKNNAAIGLIRAFGYEPHVLGRHWKQILKALHMPLHGLPKHGLISFDRWRLLHKMGFPQHAPIPNPHGHPWSARQHPRRAKYLESMGVYLRAIRRTATLTRYYIPIFPARRPPRFARSAATLLASMRGASMALTLQAMRELHQGHPGRCRRDIQADYRLAALLSQETKLICALVANGISVAGCNAQMALARYLCQHVPPKGWKWKIAQPRMGPFWFAVSTEDRFEALDTAFAVFERGPGVLGLSVRRTAQIHPRDKTWVFQQINFQYDRLTRLATVRNYHQFRRQAAILKKLVRARSDLRSTSPGSPDLIYHAIVSPLRTYIGAMLRMNFQSRAARRVARIALALAIYHARHKAFPKTLQQLRGTFMVKVPPDPFTGKSFLYARSARGCVLQSAGPGGRYRNTWHWKQRRCMAVRLPN